MADDPATKPIEQAKSTEQKGGNRPGDSTTKLAGPSKSMEEKEEKRSGDSIAKLAGLFKISEPTDQELDLQRRLSLWGISKTADQESSDYGSTDWEMSELPDQGSFKSSLSDYGSREGKSKELEGVLLHTQRLSVYDLHTYPSSMQRRKGQKSGQDTVLRGDDGLELHVDTWMSTDDETHLYLWDTYFLRDGISKLAPLCPTVKHISIDFHMIHPHQFTHMAMPMPKPMPMRSVITVCFKSLFCLDTLHETLSEVSNLFPDAESLDMQMENLSFPFDQAHFPKVNSSSSLRELKLRCTDQFLGDVPTGSPFPHIYTSCPNIESLVLSGFGRWLSNKSGKFIESCKMPHLTNIHLEPFVMDDSYRFETLMNVLHVVQLTSPHLKFVEAKKVQLGDAELTSVKWSRTPSGCELQLEGASTVVPIARLMHPLSNELEGVTVLTFNRCKVDFPQKESSIRELKFLNLENPLSQTDIHNLSEMYPNVKVTHEHESQASSTDELVGATARVQVHEEQTDTLNTEEEERRRRIAIESPLHETDELVRATARVQVHEEQTDTQNTEEEEDYIAMESLLHETDEVNVKPIKLECCKRVGVEGGTLQLDSFGIELQIPPGAIDSEAPQDISLRVLTDTPNLCNSKEEMSVCFGVQCLAPDDLVLKLPVTYTIPHCAVITRYSSVEAVLYTGEGEYSPDAEVKEQIPLTQSGIPNCNIERDKLRLQMNHFSWAFIRFKLTVFFGGKRMRCLPFAEKPLPEKRTTVILRAHLYDDIKGIYTKIASQEEGVGLACIHPEAEVLIRAAEVDVKMTCFIKHDPIGDTVHTVKYDELQIGHQWTKSFDLDLSSQPDNKIIVILQVGQTGQSLVDLHCIFNFAMNSSGKQDDFEKKLTTVARNVATRVDIDNLRKALRLQPGDVQHYVNDNNNSSYMVTLSMLRDWRKTQTKAKECEALKNVLEEAGQTYLAHELFVTS